MSDYQTTAQSRDVYQKVTDAIVNAIEQGAGSYRMPWVVRQDKGFSPISVSTVKPYRGVNTLVLWSQSQSKGYTSALWGTYQQWQSLGGQVRKGEHGSPVVYWGTYESKDTAEDEHDERSGRHLFCKGYTVFNLDQVDGCKLPKRFEPTLSHNERIGRAESFFAEVGVQVRDDLQVRAEMIIKAEPGRWAFTPNELSDLLEGLNAILQHSKPDEGWPFRLTLKQYIGLFTPIHHGVS